MAAPSLDAAVALRLSALVVDPAVLGPSAWTYLESVCARMGSLSCACHRPPISSSTPTLSPALERGLRSIPNRLTPRLSRTRSVGSSRTPGSERRRAGSPTRSPRCRHLTRSCLSSRPSPDARRFGFARTVTGTGAAAGRRVLMADNCVDPRRIPPVEAERLLAGFVHCDVAAQLAANTRGGGSMTRIDGLEHVSCPVLILHPSSDRIMSRKQPSDSSPSCCTPSCARCPDAGIRRCSTTPSWWPPRSCSSSRRAPERSADRTGPYRACRSARSTGSVRRALSG